MGFRFQRRINLGGGAGLNLSKSGISSSVRTRFGSIGSKGFSIRTGVPGLTYRSRYRKGSDAGLIVLLVLALVALLPLLLSALVAVAQLLLTVGAWTLRTLVIAPANLIRHRIEQRRGAGAVPLPSAQRRSQEAPKAAGAPTKTSSEGS
jgi:hypothetical protein